MSLPYIAKASPKTDPISAGGLNNNFSYLETNKLDIEAGVPPPPTDPLAVFVLASKGGFMFWMNTEECP